MPRQPSDEYLLREEQRRLDAKNPAQETMFKPLPPGTEVEFSTFLNPGTFLRAKVVHDGGGVLMVVETPSGDQFAPMRHMVHVVKSG